MDYSMNYAVASQFQPLHLLMLVLFLAIVVGHIARLVVYSLTSKVLQNYFDPIAEFVHIACGALMVPMVVSSLMMNSVARSWLSLIALLCGIFFSLQGIKNLRSIIHVSFKQTSKHNLLYGFMFLGMAYMYFTHSRILVSSTVTLLIWVLFGIFYLLFSLYYIKQLADILRGKKHLAVFELVSPLSHLIIGLSMFAMIVWPNTFMAIK